jgi:hypothetical protein
MVGPRLQGLAVAPPGVRRDGHVGGILQRYASAGGQERLFGFHDEAAAMGYLVLAVGGRGRFDFLEPRR